MSRNPIAPIVALLGALAPASAAMAEEVESPIYRSWAKHKPGTAVTIKSVTVMLGRTIETKTTYTLVALTNEKADVEMVVVSDATGQSIKNAPHKLTYNRTFPLLPGVKKEDIGKPEGVLDHGEETVKLGGKDYSAQWYDTKARTEAGESTTRTWMSDKVPGKLLKSVTKVPVAKKETTIELTEIKTP